jgi:Ca-activated chloride channel family protein
LIHQFERSIAVYLVIDISGSMRGEKLQAAKIGLSAFLAQLREERGDAAGLIAFSTEPSIEVGLNNLSENADQLGERIAQLEVQDKTALIDAIRTAGEQLANHADQIRAIVVLTDGMENASRTREEELLSFVRQFGYRGISIYGLAYGDGADLDRLQRLSAATGGETFKGTISNVRRLYELIAGSL